MRHLVCSTLLLLSSGTLALGQTFPTLRAALDQNAVTATIAPQQDHAQPHEHPSAIHQHCHHEHAHFDQLHPYEHHSRGNHAEHGHSGHTSVEGYPFMHGIRTEIDFIERALELNFANTNNADGGALDEREFEVELIWAIHDRAIVIIAAPLLSLDPVDEPNTTGYGDLELGLQFLAFNGRRSMLFFGLGAVVPTGDADRDLGAGHPALEPTALFLYDFGRGSYFQSRLGIEMPVGITGEIDNEFRYDFGLYHTLTQTKCWPMFRFLTPALELNGISVLNGAESGHTVVDVTSGVRWIVRDEDEVGLGWSFPVTGPRNLDGQLLLSYLLHF